MGLPAAQKSQLAYKRGDVPVMSVFAVYVRYPGVPDRLPDPSAALPPDVSVASMNVSSPSHTTLHMHIAAEDVHGAMQTAMETADRIATDIGLEIRHATAIAPHER